MASSPAALLLLLLLLLLVFFFSPSSGEEGNGGGVLPRFAEAPQFRDGEGCPAAAGGGGACAAGLVHIAMTLDEHYLRGSMAAIFSLLKHASCPDSLFFHLVASDPAPERLRRAVAASFPSLRFGVYSFPASLLPRRPPPACVPRAIYLDSDVLAVDDVRRLWATRLPSAAVVAAPEYCRANFTRYFTPAFWSDPALGPRAFRLRRRRRRPPCYFNTGVMLVDLRRWRAGGYRRRIEAWMGLQRQRRIYELGSLPPFLLVFAGEIEAVDHRWNQHGLGGDNVHGSCRPLHPGPVSLMHWSGKGKPWDRLDAANPCPSTASGRRTISTSPLLLLLLLPLMNPIHPLPTPSPLGSRFSKFR
uniref:Hexosyltransferase n=1 Tax=Ananas comosus var. bracteatus TaxID=296719 RepID=A0A6V7P7B5_ANACO|nr:unnamed protein product [Ananas comosus var. bracteatus]